MCVAKAIQRSWDLPFVKEGPNAAPAFTLFLTWGLAKHRKKREQQGVKGREDAKQTIPEHVPA